MRRAGVITDTTACLPEEVAKKYDIRLVPVDVVFEGRVYRDGVDISPAEFYRLLEQAPRLPTTSPASPASYLQAYHEVSQRAESILCLTVASSFSTMFDSARIARELAKESLPHIPIEVLDCRTAAGAQGLVALAAARAAAAGEDLAGVVQEAQRVMSRVHLLAFLDTLHYLMKGGRVPKAAAWASSLLQIKPLLQILPLSGEASPVGRVRTKPRAVQRLLDIMQRRVPESAAVHAIVMHANVLQDAERLKQALCSRFRCVEVYIKDFTPVMGVHTGPGVLGVAFYAEES